jgi:hypothetical protein
VTRKRRPPFDPLGLLATLERHRVSYIVAGGLARVIQGTDELTRGVDVVPSTRADNLRRLSAALDELGAPDVELSATQPVSVTTLRGDLRIVPLPAGTRGYEDLRRAAAREPLGKGLRPAVASKGDLARMLSALDRDEAAEKLRQLRRLIELERELGVGLGL